jgi:molybdate/tungstate transport system substrate-binding protein
VQLIALLEAREVDYAFAYQTVAEQHRLEYVALPDELNLGNDIYADTYGRVEVRLDFQRFATVLPQFTGQVIGYGLTIPSNAPHPEMAEIFIAWLLGPEGRAVMVESGHPMFDQPQVDAWDRLPEGLRDLVVPAGS